MPLRFQPKAESEISRFSNLPEGDYPFTVLESSIQVSKSAKNAGKEMVKLKINVHGNDSDRHVYDYFADWFSEWKLKHFCEAVNLGKEYAAGEIDPADNAWQGRDGFVRIVVETDQIYGEKNAVSDYLPTDAQKLDKPAAKPTQPKPKANATAPATNSKSPVGGTPADNDVPF